VLQERELEPLGSTKTIEVDVRIIASTNRNLQEEVNKGNFREDLFYRLNVVPVEIPPLRERREDINLLIDHFLAIYNDKNGRAVQGFHPRAIDAIMRYDWPGNIRELENVVERSVILTRDDYVMFQDLPETIRGAQGETYEREIRDGLRPGISLKEMERELIIKTLEDNDGNRTRTSAILGITRRTLQHKLKEYEIDIAPN
jgi:two-component system response regulator HydG